MDIREAFCQYCKWISSSPDLQAQCPENHQDQCSRVKLCLCFPDEVPSTWMPGLLHELFNPKSHVTLLLQCVDSCWPGQLLIKANIMDHQWYKKWAERSCFIRWAQYLALFILVSGLWVLIPCAAVGGRYLQGWERWVTGCSLQRLLRPYWDGRMGPGVGLRDPAGLGPQHCRAVLLALVLDGRLQCCKRGQEWTTRSQQPCQGLQRWSNRWDGSKKTLQTKQEQEMLPMEARGVFTARQDTRTLHRAVHEHSTPCWSAEQLL